MGNVEFKKIKLFEPIKKPLSEDWRGHGFSEPVGVPTEADIDRGISQMCKSIQEAIKEAMRHSIEANMVVISDELYYSRLCINDYGVWIDHPMICGLKAVLAKDELPEDTLFAVSHADNLPWSISDELERLRSENKELRAFKERVLAALEEKNDDT